MILADDPTIAAFDSGIGELIRGFHTGSVLNPDLDGSGAVAHDGRQRAGRSARRKKREERGVPMGRSGILIGLQGEVAPSFGAIGVEHLANHDSDGPEIPRGNGSGLDQHGHYTATRMSPGESTSPRDSGDEIASLRLAATALPLRMGAAGIEVLMVRRNPELAFGGMWTFPGGAIDSADGPVPPAVVEGSHVWGDAGLVRTAARAAARETLEETALSCAPADLTWFSHWIPPRRPKLKRFATWFFLAPEPSGELVVDLTENSEARWVRPDAAIEEYSRGDFPLAVPTWITLDDLQTFDTPESAVSDALESVRIHHTRLLRSEPFPVLVWSGDAAHATGDLDSPGPRNRVEMAPDGGVRSRTVSD